MRQARDFLMGIHIILISILICFSSCESRPIDSSVKRITAEERDSVISFYNPFSNTCLRVELDTGLLEVFNYSCNEDICITKLGLGRKSVEIIYYKKFKSKFFYNYRDSLFALSKKNESKIIVKQNRVDEYSTNSVSSSCIINGELVLFVFHGFEDEPNMEMLITNVISKVNINSCFDEENKFKFYNNFIQKYVGLSSPFKIVQILNTKSKSTIEFVDKNGDKYFLNYNNLNNFIRDELPPYPDEKEKYLLVANSFKGLISFDSINVSYFHKGKTHVFSIDTIYGIATTSFYSKDINLVLTSFQEDRTKLSQEIEVHKTILSNLFIGDIY